MSNDITDASPEAGILAISADFDPSRYAGELASFDMTEAQKTELLTTLWQIMCSFVDLGFRVDICEQLFADFNEVAAGDSRPLEWANPTQPETLPQKASVHE